MDDSMKLLEKWVIDESKVVTIDFLLQHTQLDAIQIQSLFKEFLSKHRELHATYYVIGETAEGPNALRQCLIVRKEEMDRVKNKYRKLVLCNVNSVHKFPIESMEVLFNADWQEEDEADMDTEYLNGKTFINCEKANKCSGGPKVIAESENSSPDKSKSPRKPNKKSGLTPTKNEAKTSPTKIQKTEKSPAKAAPRLGKKTGTQMKISNFFSSK